MTRTVLAIGMGLITAAGLGAQPQDAVNQQQRLADLQARLQQLAVNVRQLAPREGFGPTVTGSPFSAREERKTVQTLADGTVLESSDTSLVYRDSEGRTRTEATTKSGSTISISDPVAGVRLRLDPATRTVARMAMPGGGRGGRGGAPTRVAIPNGMVVIEEDGMPRTSSNTKTEDLGGAMQNGVMAQGTRTTVTIPQGQIGNSRDIRVVNERWYSKELQMMVKTTNSDPRFGVTTYELTNISRSAPDPMLFQAPADYTVTEESGGRMGRQ